MIEAASDTLQSTTVKDIQLAETPAVSGLSRPQDFPPLVAPRQVPVTPARLATKAQAPSVANTSTSTSKTLPPVIPILPKTPSRVSTPIKEVKPHVSVTMGSNISKISPLVEEETSKIPSKKAVVDASGSPQGKGLLTSASLLDFSLDNRAPETSNGKQRAELDAPIKPVEKRQRPGRLDITAAQDALKKDMQSVENQLDSTKLETPEKTDKPSVLGHSAISRPGTPSTAISRSGSPAPRAVQSRTIRMVPTPKLESHRILSPAVLAIASSPPVDKQPSRRGTPVSEMISDNVSITSTLSRANSPPPSKVGSAPVRQTTKSQQKKERQARSKLVEKGTKTEEAPAKEVEEEPVQAPIMGRKKKAKKAATEGTATSTPMASRPPSSSPPAEEKSSQEDLPAPTTPVKEAPKEVKESKKGSKKDAVKVQKEKQAAKKSPSPPAPSTSDPQEKNTLTAAAIIADLQKSGEILLSALDVFKNVAGLNQRFDIQPNEVSNQHDFPSLTDAQRLQLDQGEAVSIEDTISGRPVIVLPDKQVVRGLTPEQASRYLELRSKTLSSTGPSSFMPSRAAHQTTGPTAPLPADALALAQRSLEEASSELVNRFAGPLDSAAMSYWTSAGLPGVADAMREGKVADMSVEEAEQAMLVARKETEALEKRLNGLMKKNRRMVFGSGH